MGIRIVTDSTAYLTSKQINDFNIQVVPLAVILENDNFREGTTYSNSEFFDKLRNSTEAVTTSQPPAGDFLKVYKEIHEEGDEIISIHLSSELSGAFNNAKSTATLLPEAKISMFDSKSTISGLQAMTIHAAKAAKAGYSRAEIIKMLELMRDNATVLFLVDTLEYLKRGGRIGGAQALLGTILQIKPILHIHEGKIDVFEKVRTKQKALFRLKSVFTKFIEENGTKGLWVTIPQVDTLEEAKELRNELNDLYPELEINLQDVGPVIGAHVGPGSIGISFGKLPPL
ncbi:DegV family protein with EDD domain [Desulfitispora alkaliphila]|uniref:DegV family protein n=1 Tax=Desulfitispora alkaliphila TaxID=622674 RepID=UPI003D25EF51